MSRLVVRTSSASKTQWLQRSLMYLTSTTSRTKFLLVKVRTEFGPEKWCCTFSMRIIYVDDSSAAADSSSSTRFIRRLNPETKATLDALSKEYKPLPSTGVSTFWCPHSYWTSQLIVIPRRKAKTVELAQPKLLYQLWVGKSIIPLYMSILFCCRLTFQLELFLKRSHQLCHNLLPETNLVCVLLCPLNYNCAWYII